MKGLSAPLTSRVAVLHLLGLSGRERSGRWLVAAPFPPTLEEWPRGHQEIWLVLGEWMQPGEDLLSPLRSRLRVAAEDSDENPLTRLPAGYRSGISTLRRSSAE